MSLRATASRGNVGVAALMWFASGALIDGVGWSAINVAMLMLAVLAVLAVAFGLPRVRSRRTARPCS